MCGLNKVNDMGVQFVSDKENKKVVYNQLKSFTNDSFVYPCSIIPLYSDTNLISLLSYIST